MSEVNLDIKFFKNDKQGKRLGGGYITSGGIKTAFSVFTSEKSKYKFNISLPYRKNETSGEIINEVSFINGQVSDMAHKFIAAQLGQSGGNDSEDAPARLSSNPTGSAPTKVDIKKQFKGKAPF